MKIIETSKSGELQFHINQYNCALSVHNSGKPLRLAVIDGTGTELPYDDIDSRIGGAASASHLAEIARSRKDTCRLASSARIILGVTNLLQSPFLKITI